MTPCCQNQTPKGPLNALEKKLLERFGELAFLPVVTDRETSLRTLPDEVLPESLSRIALLTLEQRGLVRVDAELPLSGFDYSAYSQRCLCGSAALTALGQDRLDALLYGGVE